jgi:hypothetical protein
LKPCREQSRLCALGIGGHEVEVAEAADAVGIAATQLRPFDEQKRAVAGRADPSEENGRDQRRRARSAFLARKLLGKHLPIEPRPTSGESSKPVIADEFGRESVEKPPDAVPQSDRSHQPVTSCSQ